MNQPSVAQRVLREHCPTLDMKNDIKKYLGYSALLAGSAVMVSCDGDDGDSGAAGAAGTTTVITETTSIAFTSFADMKESYFPISDLKLTIETDALVGEPLEHYELSYDFDSNVSADLDVEDDFNAVVVTNGEVVVSGLSYVDGSNVANIDSLDHIENVVSSVDLKL